MSNLPVKKEEGFFQKIKDFFRGLFGSKERKLEIKEEIKTEEKDIISIKDTLKESVNTDKEQISSMNKDSYLQELENNPELLKNLSVERLEVLRDHYSNVVEDLRRQVNESTDILSNMDKDSFIKEIEKNPEILNQLSIERLEKLRDFYKEEIKELKKKLAA